MGQAAARGFLLRLHTEKHTFVMKIADNIALKTDATSV
jgi:hypothetical protein